MKLAFLVFAMIVLSGCLRVSGTMNVSDSLVFKHHGKTDVLLTGEYAARATVKGQDKIVVYLSNDFEKKEITLKFPEGTILPRENGDFSVNRTQLNQPFSVSGNFTTTVNASDVMETQESCQIAMGTVCDDFAYGPSYPNRCHVEYERGFRDIKYRNVTTVKSLKFKLDQEGQEKAEFKGKQVDEKREYLFVGPCML